MLFIPLFSKKVYNKNKNITLNPIKTLKNSDVQINEQTLIIRE